MTTAEVLLRPPLLARLIGQFFRTPGRSDAKATPERTLSPPNLFEVPYDQTRPFFMQPNWGR